MGLPRAVLYDVVGLGTLGAILAGIRLHRPNHVRAWHLLAASQAFLVVGDVLWQSRTIGRPIQMPLVSLADVPNLIGYLLLAASVIALVTVQGRRLAGPALVDAMVFVSGMMVIVWVVAIDPFMDSEGLSPLNRSVTGAYGVLAVVIMYGCARLLVSPAGREPAATMLVLSFFLLLCAYGMLSASSTYRFGTPSDALWVISYAVRGAAALHPSMRRLTRPEVGRSERPRVFLLWAAAIVAPLAFGMQQLIWGGMDVALMVSASVILITLVLVRVSGLVKDVEARAADMRRQGEELRESLQALEATQAERRILLDRTVQAAEGERLRLAAEPHDGPVQRLTALALRMGNQRRKPETGTADAERFVSLEELLREEIGSLRSLMAGLRPPVLDEFGLSAALQDQGRQFSRSSGIACDVQADEVTLEPSVETVLYRVAQESLANVVKHAQASRVWVELSRQGPLVRLRVRDDGLGFRARPSGDLLRDGHFGLVGMRERVEMAGGTWAVTSEPGTGTTIEVSVGVGLL